MSDEDVGVLYGLTLSARATLEEAAARLSHGGGIVGSPQDGAKIELATALQALEMARYWIAKIKEGAR